MSKKPVISVIVTVHNQIEFIHETIGGFAQQDINVPYEIIAVCDNCTDGSDLAIKNSYPNVRIEKVEYKHPCVSRNHGIDLAKGDFICFFDGDDTPHSNYLSKLYEALQKNPDKNLAYGRFNYPGFGLEAARLPACNYMEWTPSWLQYGPINNTPMMIRRELIDKGARWEENIRTREDYEFTHSLVKAGAKGVHVRDVIWDYRLHEGSIWGSNRAAALATHSMKFLQKKHNLNAPDLETMFISILSRRDLFEEYFKNIAEIDMPRNEMHYFVFIDSNDEELIKDAIERAEKLKFASLRVFVTNEESLVDEMSFYKRGMRIARNVEICMNEAKKTHGGAKYVFMVEDDTKVPADSYQKLKKHLDSNENLGYVSGCEVSRAESRHMGIAHLKGDEFGQVIHRINPHPKKKGLENITSGGWYCWMGRVDAIVGQKYRCTNEENDERMIGPDAYFVYDLHARGYDTQVDWSIWCDHYSSTDGWLTPNDAIMYEFEHLHRNDQWIRMMIKREKK